MKYPVKIGIIGGTGLDNPDILSDRKEESVETPFGLPSDSLVSGRIGNVSCVILARHGRGHTISPSSVNYRANIWALKSVGCTHILVSTACGSLREEINPGSIVILDNFIDRTTKREQSLYGADNADKELRGICHLPMEPAFCERTRKIVINAAKARGITVFETGTCITIEGPRFSSKAESRLYRSWGADVINMTTVPEVVLAKEAGLCYSAIAIATDYDCWKDTGERVCVGDVMATFKANVSRVCELIQAAVQVIAEEDWTETIDSLRNLVKDNVMGGH